MSIKTFAILVRASVLTRSFEEKLALYNYPYRLIGGNKFLERSKGLFGVSQICLQPK